MKRLLLIFLSVFFFKAHAEEAIVRVSAQILTPLKVEVIQHINFGDIFKGGKNFQAKDKGELKVTGNGRVKLLWKDSADSEYQSMNKNLNTTMSNNRGNSFIAIVSPNSVGNLDDFIVSETTDKVVKISGKIENLNKSLPEGDYNGAILIRAEYLSN